MTRMGLRAVVEGHTTSAFCVAFDPSGEHAFTGADDGLIKVWHVRSSYLVRTLRGHRSEITDVSIHESGSHLASASNDHTVRIWSLCEEGMPCVAVFPSAPPSSPGSAGAGVAAPIITALWRSIALYRPEHQLLTFTDAGLATLWTKVASDGGAPAPSSPVLHGWTPRSTQLQVKDQSGFEVFDAAWSAAGVRAAVGTSDCLAYILRMNDDHMPVWVATLRGHRHDVTTVQWSSDGTRLATGSKDGTARLWRCKGDIKPGEGRVLAAATDSGLPSERWGCTTLGRLKLYNDVTGETDVVPLICAVAWRATTPGPHRRLQRRPGVWCATPARRSRRWVSARAPSCESRAVGAGRAGGRRVGGRSVWRRRRRRRPVLPAIAGALRPVAARGRIVPFQEAAAAGVAAAPPPPARRRRAPPWRATCRCLPARRASTRRLCRRTPARYMSSRRTLPSLTSSCPPPTTAPRTFGTSRPGGARRRCMR